MTPLQEATGRRRRTLYVPASGESVQRGGDRGALRASDPPIYRELLRHWAGKGRTLPGHRDPEWARLTAPIVRPGQFGSADPFTSPPAGAGPRPPRQFAPEQWLSGEPAEGGPAEPAEQVSGSRDPRGDGR